MFEEKQVCDCNVKKEKKKRKLVLYPFHLAASPAEDAKGFFGGTILFTEYNIAIDTSEDVLRRSISAP